MDAMDRKRPGPEGGRAVEGVRAAETTLQILEIVAFSRDAVGVTQIAGEIGLAKSAVFKHLQTLMNQGYIAQDPVSAQYRLGAKAWLISRLAPPADDIAGIAEPLMREARNATGLAVVLSAPMPDCGLVVATFPGTKSIEIGVRPGSELGFHSSAQGKVFLAYGPKSRLDRLRGRSLEAFTPETITSLDRLIDDVGEVRKRGYATAPNQSMLGVNTIAAPVYDHRDQLVASVGIVGSVQYVPQDPDPLLVERILALSQAISRALGNGLVPNGGTGF